MKKSIALLLLGFFSLSVAGTFQLLNPQYDKITYADQLPSETGDQLRVSSNGVQQVPYVLANHSVYFLREGLSDRSKVWAQVSLSDAMQALLNNPGMAASFTKMMADSCGNFYAFIDVKEAPDFRVFRYTPSVQQWVPLNPTSNDRGYRGLSAISPISGALRDHAGNVLLLGTISGPKSIVQLSCYSGRNSTASTVSFLRRWGAIGQLDFGTRSVQKMYQSANSSWRYFVAGAADSAVQLYYSQTAKFDQSVGHRWENVALPEVGSGAVIRHVLSVSVEDETGKALVALETKDAEKITVSLWVYLPQMPGVRTTASWTKIEDLSSHALPTSGDFSTLQNKVVMVLVGKKVYMTVISLDTAADARVVRLGNMKVYALNTEDNTIRHVAVSHLLNNLHPYAGFNIAGHAVFYFGPDASSDVYKTPGYVVGLNATGTMLSPVVGKSNAFHIPPIDGLLPSADFSGHLYLMTPDFLHHYKVWRYTP